MKQLNAMGYIGILSIIMLNKGGIPTTFKLRSYVIQKIFETKCATSIVERIVRK